MAEDFWIPFFGMIFVIALPVVSALILAYKINQSKHAERMAMIDKGIVIEEPEKKVNKYNALRNGLLMIGLSIGAIVGLLVNRLLDVWEGGFLIFILSILGGGIAFVIYFFIARKMQKEEVQDVNG